MRGRARIREHDIESAIALGDCCDHWVERRRLAQIGTQHHSVRAQMMLSCDFAYYIVHTVQKSDAPFILAFTEWLLDEAQEQ